jgi:hypothetical protein
VELNPGMQMEEKLSDFMVEQREEMRGIREWFEKIKSSLDTISIKMDQMNETMKIIMSKRGLKDM